MDYSQITEEIIRERVEGLPSNITELLNSPDTKQTVRRIGKTHRLGGERLEMLEQLIGFTLLGLVDPDNLNLEINESLGLTPVHANKLAEELNSRVLSVVKTDLYRIYEPLAESPDRAQKGEGLMPTTQEQGNGQQQKQTSTQQQTQSQTKQVPATPTPSKQAQPQPQQAQPSPEPSQPATETKPGPQELQTQNPPQPQPQPQKSKEKTSEDKPFVLHEEKRAGSSQPEKKRGFERKRSISPGSGFFSKESGGKKETQAPQAQIQSPGQEKKQERKEGGVFGIGKKEKKRVVHYSNRRTPLNDKPKSKEGGGGSFINLSKLKPQSGKQQKEKPTQKNKNQQNQELSNEPQEESKLQNTNKQPKQNKKSNRNGPQPGPTIEGNIINLKNNNDSKQNNA